MGGTTKNEMKSKADRHFEGLRKIVPNVKRVILFDYDTENTYHPEPDNPALFEWRRKNIENYLLVPEAWRRAILDIRNDQENNIFNQPMQEMIDRFFAEQNLTLPPGNTWRDVNANIFEVVDGKRILFEQQESLFQKLYQTYEIKINRETVSKNFIPEELHADVFDFFEKLAATLN